MDQTIQFALGFAFVILIVVGVIVLAPKPVLPERSEYLTEERELQQLRAGRIAVIFFYSLQSPLCESEAQLLRAATDGAQDVFIEWINVAEYAGDRRVMDLMNEHEVDATPVLVIKNLHHETKIVGAAGKNQILVEINKLKAV